MTSHHSDLTPAQRKKALVSAKSDKGKGRPLIQGQITIKTCFNTPTLPKHTLIPTPPTKPSSTLTLQPTEEGETSETTTRYFKKFEIVGEILRFKTWLKTVDGKKKKNQQLMQ